MKAKLLVLTLVIASFALLFVIGILSVSQSVSSQINTNNKRDQIFLAEISGGIDLNKSIIIQPLVQTNGVNDVSNRDVYSFFVKNPSNEEIAFSNAGFDLRVYQYDQDREIWEAIELLTYPENRRTVLPPRLDRLDMNFLNQWTIAFSRDLPINAPQNIRLFILGQGVKSGEWYGAYVDIEIPNQ